MALVDVIKKETPQETARRLAKEKAEKAAIQLKTKVKVNVNSSEADMVKKEAMTAPITPAASYIQGAPVPQTTKMEKSFNARAATDAAGNTDNLSIANGLSGKSEEPADFNTLALKTNDDYLAARKEYIPDITGGGGTFGPSTKVMVDTAKALAEAAQEMGIVDTVEMGKKIVDIAKMAGIAPELIDQIGNGSRPFGKQMIQGGFNLIRGLKKNQKPDKPGAKLYVSPSDTN